MEHAFTNELIRETSPYLLQHAHNPVEWHAWNEVALAKAKENDKPILVSIGYSACHWCHVMEKESFEDAEVAAYMNEHFVNIKIDREERPDLDHIYMDAVQAISGSGGWPLNVFLTTDAKPFYGGTYFPPTKAFNRASWKDVLTYMTEAWQNRREEVEQQADTLLDHINSSALFVSKKIDAGQLADEFQFTESNCKKICENILKSADTMHGGFGNAPKFPQTFTIQYLLAHHHYFNDDQSLAQAELSLKKMLDGGIYDQLAGGLSRYSTDAYWLAPHFEKMLYDNALLVSVLCDACQVTADEKYKTAVDKTLHFLLEEMQHPDGGFYAALDADSEGVEGKFYVWTKKEIDRIFGEQSAIFCSWYGVTDTGNWEHSNILHVSMNKSGFAAKNNLTNEQLDDLIQSAGKKLLQERNKRIRPATDDKILLGWNALLLTAFCKAAAVFGDDFYKDQAVKLLNFIREKFSLNEEIVFHSYKNNKATHPAYLDDYAYLIQGCIQLQEITSNQEYLHFAQDLATFVIGHFHNPATGLFYYTHVNQKDVITRKVEIYDNAIPSGNSIMAENLFYLSIVFENRAWWRMAQNMLNSLSDLIIKYPTSFAVWARLVLNLVSGSKEIAVTGKNIQPLLAEVLKMFLPGKVLQSGKEENAMALLKNKIYGDKALIYLCKNYSCSAPVADIRAFKEQLKMKVK